MIDYVPRNMKILLKQHKTCNMSGPMYAVQMQSSIV